MPSDGSKAQIIVGDKIAAAEVPLLIYIRLMSTVGAHNMGNVECPLQIPTHGNLKILSWLSQVGIYATWRPFYLILFLVEFF